MNSKVKKKNKGHVAVYIILLSGVLITLLPFFWMLLTSLKSQSEAIRVPPVIFPAKPIFSNYTDVFRDVPFAKMYLNTIISSVVTVTAQLLLCSMAAYAFAKLEFPGREIIFVTLLAVLMVPSSFFILPQYLVIHKMKLLNTIPALFIPNLFSAFGTFLLRQFFMSLPSDLEDAAALDGCTPLTTYWRIMLPLAKPGLVSLGILTLRFAWNDLMWPLIVNTSQDKMTLTAGLAYMQGQYQTNFPEMMAGAMMAIVPLLILFAIFQRQFIEGIALTGIKG